MLPGLRRPSRGFECVTGLVSDNPNPSLMTAPVSSSKRRNVSTGRGAAPETQRLTLLRSNDFTLGWLMMAADIAGTAGKDVAPVFGSVATTPGAVPGFCMSDHRDETTN